MSNTKVMQNSRGEPVEVKWEIKVPDYWFQPWEGRIVYRLLATEDKPESLWMEYTKQAPVVGSMGYTAQAFGRTRLMRKLGRSQQEMLGLNDRTTFDVEPAVVS